MSFRILIVDDSKLARMAAAKTISALRPDWTRVEASGADEALALVKQSAADLVLLDFNMPGRDGLSLMAELQEIRPDLPVAVVSANHQEEIVNRAHELGATFLPKPLTAQALGEYLARAEQRLDGIGR
jgi:CheY-like chemotaxis protein